MLPSLTAATVHAFMTTNVVIVRTTDFDGLQYEDAAKKIVRLHLAKRGNDQVTYKGGNVGGGVYFLKPGRAAKGHRANCTHSFLAYWAPYQQNGGESVWLGSDVDMMFTATMSGCSFGLGSRTNDGVRAAHVNSDGVTGHAVARMLRDEPGLSSRDRTVNGLLAQVRHQHQRLTALGASDLIAHPNVYMVRKSGEFNLGVSSTPFGIRETANGRWGWNVYWQKYVDFGNETKHKGVTRYINSLG